MNSRERALTTFAHREPDRVPFDLGSVQVTGIHEGTYRRLRQALGLPATDNVMCDTIQQLATVEDDVAERLGIDFRGLYPLNSHNWQVIEEDAGEDWAYHDEWGITHHRIKESGLYFSVFQVPLPDFTVDDIKTHPWPDMGAAWRLAGLREQAEAFRAAGYAVVLKDAFAGIFEFSQRVVGMENLLMTMALDEGRVGLLFDKMLELKLAYWQTALKELGDLVDVVTYADDYGAQKSQLISPAMFRRQLKPRVQQIFELQAALAPQAKRFMHSDGNIRPIIPDFIEMGVQILNPVQTTAAQMDPVELKTEFGQDLIFWGGGIDTQNTLPRGTPQQVKDEVRHSIEILGKGGGYVFNTVHNVQADVPIANFMAMWEALQEYGVYG